MWKTVKLGDVCDVLDSLRKPITKKNRIKGDYPYYGATGVVDWVQDYIFDEKLVLVGEDGAKWDSGDTTAFIAIGKYWVNNHAHVLRPNPEMVMHEWISYYLTRIDLSEFVTGLTVPKLNQANLKIIPIPLPPLTEQQRIVAKLDAVFTKIDKANNSNHLKITETNTLTSLILDEWLTKTPNHKKIGELCDFLNGYAFKSVDAVEQSKVQLLRMGNLYGNRLDLNRKPIFYPNNFADEYQKYVLNAGDIIMTLTGTVGKEDYGYAIEVPKSDKKLLLNQRILKFYNVDRNLIHPQFFLYVLHSKQFLKSLYKTANGTRQANLSSDTIKKLEIPLPSVTEQRKLLDKIKSLLTHKDIVVKNAEKNIQNYSQIKSAILAQALQPTEAA